MKKHSHNWQPLFIRPTDRHEQKIRLDWILAGVSEKSAVICPECGAVGMTSGGYSKGGGRNVVTLSEDRAEHWQQKAALWNQRLPQSLQRIAAASTAVEGGS